MLLTGTAFIVWQARWTARSWRTFLATGKTEWTAFRQCTHIGRPLGAPEFLGSLERKMHCNLAPQKRGRRTKTTVEKRQATLMFDP
jgi:hypothetical protein